MKKAKIMLLTIAIVAAVGGTLAFNTKFSSDVCTLATTTGGACPAARKCPIQTAIPRDVQASQLGNICYSVLPVGQKCEDQDCVVKGFTEIEDVE